MNTTKESPTESLEDIVSEILSLKPAIGLHDLLIIFDSHKKVWHCYFEYVSGVGMDRDLRKALLELMEIRVKSTRIWEKSNL